MSVLNASQILHQTGRRGGSQSFPGENYSAPFTTTDEGSLEIIDQIADRWGSLSQDASNDEPFYRPEWIRAYAKCFEPGANLRIVRAERNQRLIGVLPLVR